MKVYRGAAAAARAYVEADRSRADDYYLAEGTGLATRYVATPETVGEAGGLDGPAYERWVAGYRVETGEPKGRLRADEHGVRFVEVVVNGPKTWSLAAALHPDVAAAYDAAQDKAATQIIGWLAQHATTRVGPRGRQVQVPVQEIEAAVVRHYTSRAGDPHRHLHLQINARVWGAGKWRGLHTVGVRDSLEAINGIGHAAVLTDPGFRTALADHGLEVDAESGEIVQLAPYVGGFSARAAQIGRNVHRYEAEWRAANPGAEPGPRLRAAWDRRAWAQARPDKVVPTDGADLVARWNQELRELGFRDPVHAGPPTPTISSRGAVGPGVSRGPRVGCLDRDGAAGLVVSRLGAARSAWNAADVRGGVERWVAATGLVADAAVRIELAQDITARALNRCVPLLAAPGVPEHVRSLTSRRVLDVEADLVASMTNRANRASDPVEPSAPTARSGHRVVTAAGLGGLGRAQQGAVAVLAGDARLVVVEGAAGAGKTTTLAAVHHELAHQGRRMVVVTPTLKAAQVAEHETGTRAWSAAALVHRFGWSWDDDGHWRYDPTSAVSTQAPLGRGDLLLVDEAGMLDQDTAHALLQVADHSGARIAFVGDRHQLPAVGRGGVLDHAARWAAPGAVVDLDVVHRFSDPEYAAISQAMRTGERIGVPPGRHPGGPVGDQSRQPAGKRPGQAPGEAFGEPGPQADEAPGERCGERAGEVFDALLHRDQIRVHASDAERLHAIAAEAAHTIAENMSSGAAGAGAGVVVMADGLAQVAALNGVIRDRLVAAGHVDDTRAVVTDAGERIGVGDRVATRLNNPGLGVANRDTWTVAAVATDGSLTLAPLSQDRAAGHVQAAVVPAWYVRTRVELGYASTVYGAQGQTTGTGHMLIGEATSGSAAYVGMTRGRDHNVAHLVADSLGEARATWNAVMGRDRADLGPAHAARAAAGEMERYAPQRPRQILLDQLKAAWSNQADLTDQHTQLDHLRQEIEDVRAIRATYQPQLDRAGLAEQTAYQRWETTHHRARDLEVAIADQQRDLTAGIARAWRTEQPHAYQALDVLRDGDRPLARHRARVREARKDLLGWARRWEPILPELTPHTDDLRHGAEHVAAVMDRLGQAPNGEDRVRQAISSYATDILAAAHREHDTVVAEAEAAEHALRATEQRRTDLRDQQGKELRVHRRLAYAADLPGTLDQTRRDLDTLGQRLATATERVDRLTGSPEVRSLPAGRLEGVRDQWRAGRAEDQQAALAQARRRAAMAQARAAEEAARRLRTPAPDPLRPSGRDYGPGIGF